MLNRLALILTGLVLLSACASPQITEPLTLELIEASHNSLTSYTFSVTEELKSADFKTLEVYRETTALNPRAQQIDISYYDYSNQTKIERSYRRTNRWYEISDNKCLVRGGNDPTYKQEIEVTRFVKLSAFVGVLQGEIKQLEGSEYNGIPAKHYFQSDAELRQKNDGTYPQSFSSEWWLTDDNLVLWAQFTNELVVDGELETTITTYTLEQYNQAVNVEIPSICTK